MGSDSNRIQVTEFVYLFVFIRGNFPLLCGLKQAQGCDASILLDPVDGMGSEKDSSTNELLKGYDIIDAIKSEIERLCPRVVSCADILVLAAREAILTVKISTH